MNNKFHFIFQIIIASTLMCAASQSAHANVYQPWDDNNRLQGFAEHNKAAEEFDSKRQKGADEVKKQQAEYDRKQEEARLKFVQSKVAVQDPDETPAYQVHLREKYKEILSSEKALDDYVMERRRQDALRAKRIVSEEQEYGISDDEKNRVAADLRRSGGGSGSAKSSGRGMGVRRDTPSFSPSSPFAPPRPPGFEESPATGEMAPPADGGVEDGVSASAPPPPPIGNPPESFEPEPEGEEIDEPPPPPPSFEEGDF